MRRRQIVLVRPRARRDVDEIADYIAQDSVAAGRRFFDPAQRTFRDLARMPRMGAPRTYQNPQMADVRSWQVRGFRNYLIFYRPTTDGIEVIRVLHGARDLEAILEAEELNDRP